MDPSIIIIIIIIIGIIRNYLFYLSFLHQFPLILLIIRHIPWILMLIFFLYPCWYLKIISTKSMSIWCKDRWLAWKISLCMGQVCPYITLKAFVTKPLKEWGSFYVAFEEEKVTGCGGLCPVFGVTDAAHK